MRYPSPGPLARATLSRWERDLPQNNSQFVQLLLQFLHNLYDRGQSFSRSVFYIVMMAVIVVR